MILYAIGNKPYRHPEVYDKDEKRFYSLSYRPKTWAATTEYRKGFDLVIPPTPNGLMYECTSGGLSDAGAPTFSTVEGSTTSETFVKWKALPYDLLLNTGDAITVSTWVGTNGETIDNESIVGGIQTKFRLTAVPSGASTATIINHITVTRANGDVEELDRSLIIRVREL